MKKVLDNLEEYIGGSLFLIMLLVLIIQIVSRQILNLPLKWSEELARFLFVYVGYFGVSASIKDNAHVYIEFFVEKLPKPAQKIINVFIQFLVLVILMILFYIGYTMTVRKIPVQIVSLNISYAYMYAALPIISLMMIYRHIERNIKEWKEKR